MTEPVKVLIEVRGGVVTSVMSAGVALDVIVCDWDCDSDSERMGQVFADDMTATGLVNASAAKCFY